MANLVHADSVVEDLLFLEHPLALDEALSPLVLLDALENSNRGTLIFDRHLQVMHATRLTWNLLGIPLEVPAGRPDLIDLLSRSTLDHFSVAAAKEQIVSAVGGEGDNGPLLLSNREKSWRGWLRLKALQSGYFAASFESVAEEKTGLSSLAEDHNRDFLTGLATRSFFERSLATALSGTNGTGLALLLLDLDRFKAVNDTLGHPIGDRLLRLVAERLQSTVQKDAVVARLGGDEFAILIDQQSTREGSAALAKRILDLVQRTYLIEGQLVNIGTSVGIAIFPEDGADTRTLFRNADLALYHSKETGRGIFSFFDEGMERRAGERRTNELELRKALALRQLELHYQPQVDSFSGKLAGFEALLRWRHPERGLIPPGTFLPIAEAIGVIVPIGDWVLRTACREAMNWPGDLVVAVNAAPQQFDTGKFGETVRRTLLNTGLPGERLEIEITEGFLLRNTDLVHKTLQELRTMKVRIAMDDFGTGYASLSQLAQFPFDKIKIDRSLAGFEGDNMKQRAIVRAITELGRSLGIATLAEGVENAEQLARLQTDGCTSVQGYHLGRPAPPSQLSEIISRLSAKTE